MLEIIFKIKQRIFRQTYLSWEYFDKKTLIQKAIQPAYQNVLKKMSGANFGTNCYISPTAHIYTSNLHMGDESYISGGCIMRGKISMGDGCCIGANSHIAGPATFGANTMIANNVSIFAFNHGMDPSQAMRHQACSSKGIAIGDDCWIGANVSIVDGVTIGSHSVIAAGAVVTSDIPAWSIAGGVPARVIKSRKDDNVRIFSEEKEKLSCSG